MTYDILIQHIEFLLEHAPSTCDSNGVTDSEFHSVMKKNLERLKKARDEQNFIESLEQASKEVASWPEWKQNALGPCNDEPSDV